MANSEMTPTKWWQWVLAHPALAIAILGSIPTGFQLANSVIPEVGYVGYGEASNARKQNALWQKYGDCVSTETNSITTESAHEVAATVCPSGNVLVHVNGPNVVTAYQWVSVDDFFEPEPTFELVSKAKADNLIVNTADQSKKTKVICKRMLTKKELLRRISVSNESCHDEVVNTFTGKIVRRESASCEQSC